MYIIQFSVEDKLFNEIKDRFEELSLAYKVERCEELPEIILRHSEQRWSGTSIFEHLNQTEAELRHWHYCNC